MAEPPVTPSRNRGLGASLGGAFESLARRVSNVVAEVSETVSIPEPIRRAIEQARQARSVGEHARAEQLLEQARQDHGDHRALTNAVTLTRVAQAWFDPTSVSLPKPSGDPDASGRAVGHLVAASGELEAGQAQPALDELRRAVNDLSRISESDRNEVAFLIHAGRARAYELIGAGDRRLRELRKAQARLAPGDTGAYRWLVQAGTSAFLEQDRADAGHEWLSSLRGRRVAHQSAREPTPPDGPAQPAAETNPDLLAFEREAFVRLATAREDRASVTALLDQPGFAPGPELRVDVALLTDPSAALELAQRLRQERPNDVDLGRIWALARLASPEPTDSTERVAVLEALLAYAEAQPPARRPICGQELAHVALTLEDWSPRVRRAVDDIARDNPRAPREIGLYLARAHAETGEETDAPPFLALDSDDLAFAMETDEFAGPDERSPLRDVVTRFRVLAGQQHLLAARSAMKHQQPARASAALVDALSEDPGLHLAEQWLGDLAQPAPIDNLEEALVSATELLADAASACGTSPAETLTDASRQVIRARERLARPLTIAVMGEFSAGKSTFVNALLGASVAPMGVLPTTSTINVFRRGQQGGAYIHRRDGELRHVAAEDITAFLQGIDDAEAKAIRYVELERREGRLGEVTVVDTPGLNALDPYHERVAREFLDQADAVIWVFSATRGVTASEAEVLTELHDSGRRLLGVLNKIDTVPDAERDPLVDYVRERLDGQLAALVPTTASEALQWHEAPQAAKPDPLQPVLNVLEQVFFVRARQLKRKLAARQLDDALGLAIEHVDHAASELEQTANTGHDEAARRVAVRGTLHAVSDSLLASVDKLADTLARELMALGLLSVDDGRRRAADEQDFEYLGAVFEDVMMSTVGGVLDSLELGEHDRAVARAVQTVVRLRFLPWLHGQITGLLTQGFVATVLDAASSDARRGEAAMQAGIATVLRPVAATWRERTLQLRKTVELTLSRSHRRDVGAPRALALRLRATVLAPLRALRDSTAWRDHPAPPEANPRQ
ncbi:MAG: hypothetical protein B7733_10560 [Myxococcales bacterium FL481]|nr:MAG: hypothetical protein B7733_10560 [Myxococcales bacterium FL481]